MQNMGSGIYVRFAQTIILLIVGSSVSQRGDIAPHVGDEEIQKGNHSQFQFFLMPAVTQ